MATPVRSTTNFNCYLIGTQLSHPDYEEPLTIVETWHIKAKESAFGIVNPEVVYANLVTELAIPPFGRVYGNWLGGRTPNWFASNGWQYLYCTNIEYSKNKDGTIIARLTWSNRKKQQNTQTGTVQLQYPIMVEAASQQRETILYKRTWTSTPPDPALDQTASISGDNIAGNPRDGMPYYVNQVRYRIRRAFDSKIDQVEDVASYFNDHIGKRNSIAFMGNAALTCVFEGYNIVKLEGPFYEITFDVVYDEFAFHNQTIDFAADGLPVTDATGLNYANVKWTRPAHHGGTYDFNGFTWSTTIGIADTTGKQIMEKGYWLTP